MKSKVVILFFFTVCTFVFFNRDQQDHNQYTSDKCGYYLYLPAIFIHNDLPRMAFFDTLEAGYSDTLGLNYSMHTINGNKLNKYPVGVAIFESPLFLVAHQYCLLTKSYKADGFSLPYQLACFFSNLLFMTLGLIALRNVLKRYFTDPVVAFTLFCIAFGTNIYAYTAFDVGMSHPYSFFLFACILNITDGHYSHNKKYRVPFLLLLGLLAGLVAITRPTNIIVWVVPLLWQGISIDVIKARINSCLLYKKELLSGILAFSLIVFIQLSYWKCINGNWVYYSYNGEGFNFLHPNIWKGLFSYRKGWFVYTPMVLVCFTGFYFLWKKNRKIVPALLVFFALMIYVVFSWREWWYGGGFGCRPLIESIAFLVLPLASLAEAVFLQRKMAKKIFFSVLAGCLIILNIFQTYQYSTGILHWSRMTKEYYWKLFGHIEFDRVENGKYLINASEEFDYSK